MAGSNPPMGCMTERCCIRLAVVRVWSAYAIGDTVVIAGSALFKTCTVLVQAPSLRTCPSSASLEAQTPTTGERWQA